MTTLIQIASLTITALNLSVPVYFAPYYEKTWDIRHIGHNVALLEGTAYPDEYGNTVLAGHYAVPPSLTDGPFIRLSELTKGDIIQITYGGHVYSYEVDRYFIVGKKDLYIVDPTSDKRLTLFTCTQALANEYRYVVIARFVEGTPVPTIPPTIISPTETLRPSAVPTFTSTVHPTVTVTPVVPEVLEPEEIMTYKSRPAPIIYVDKPKGYGLIFVLLSTLASILTGILVWRNR